MNYYRRYSGDYLRDTARLSLAEHGAYCLLLDYYYSDEQPLPIDKHECYMLVRAVKREDQRAVDKVLDLYFELRADGYHQARVDREIEASQLARETAKANGSKGGRPRKGKTQKQTQDETETETKQKPSGLLDGFQKPQVFKTHEESPSNHQPPTTSTGLEYPCGEAVGTEVGRAPVRARGDGTHG